MLVLAIHHHRRHHFPLCTCSLVANRYLVNKTKSEKKKNIPSVRDTSTSQTFHLNSFPFLLPAAVGGLSLEAVIVISVIVFLVEAGRVVAMVK